MFGTFGEFWGYHSTELNFSMVDTPTACYMSKLHRLARETHNEEEGRTVESLLLTAGLYCTRATPAALHKGNSSCTLR